LENILEGGKVPVFWIGSKHSKNCIYHDDFQAGSDITKRFIDLGHREIAYADYLSPEECKNEWHFSAFDRMNGYLKAMQDAKLKSLVVRPEKELQRDEVVAYSEEKLVFNNKPTAIVTYGMDQTCRPIIYAMMRNCINIPEDVSLCTFTTKVLSENDLAVASFMPSKKDLGKISAELIFDKIQNHNLNPEPIEFPFDFCEGDTIAPPKK